MSASHPCTTGRRPALAAWWGAAVAAAALALPAAAATPPSQRTAAATPAPGAAADAGVIVGFKADAALLRRHALAEGDGATALQRALLARAQVLGQRRGRVLEAGPAVGLRAQVMRARGVPAAELARLLVADPEVAYAVPNGRMRRLTAPGAPTDPLYAASSAQQRPNGLFQQNGPQAGQWYLRAPDATFRSAIGIEGGWARTRGVASVVVAVLDTGVRGDHPDLQGRLLPGYDFVDDPVVANDGGGRDADPSDPGDWVTSFEASRAPFNGCEVSPSSWHGTATTSLVGAATDNGVGMAGAGPGLGVLPVRVLGKCFGFDSDIIAGMKWAAGIVVPGAPVNPNPAKVLNLSLGGGGACSPAYQAAVDEITARGVMIVAAAGNNDGGPVGAPANCKGVVGVAALRHAGTKVGFSDLGPEIAIAAPGGNCVNVFSGQPCLYPILAATDAGSQGPVSSRWSDSFSITVGTSFSSPLVAAVAGLVWSQRPGLTPAQVLGMLQSTARPFPTSGADNGPDDPSPVLACQPPQSGVAQPQCYCTTALCGAGMMDASAALAAASGPLPRFAVQPEAPQAGTTVTLDAAGSLAGVGAAITGYAWTLVDGGGIATGFSSASNAATATLQPTGAGTLRVRLTITDSSGASASAER
ncbi:MAG: S8 family serine peptidase, partial [Pseudomonadota bacterium]